MPEMQHGMLNGRNAIMKAFGVSSATVASWRRQGAPIVIIGRKCRAQYQELWAWLLAVYRRKKGKLR